MTYLDLIRDADRKIDNGDITLGEYEKMIEPLKREIQPERKGKWIKAQYVLTSNPAQYVWNCSECGKSVNGYSAVVLTDYCPQCGSYNGGDKNDQR